MQGKGVGKGIVRRCHEEVLGNGRLEVAEEIVDKDILMKGAGLHVQGIHAFMEHVKDLRSSMQDMQCTVHRDAEEGDKVAAWWSLTGIDKGILKNGRPTGKKIVSQGMSIFRIRDGKICEISCQQDAYGLLRQLNAVQNAVPILESGRTEGDFWSNAATDEVVASDALSASVLEANKASVRKYTNAIMNGKDMGAGPELIAANCRSMLLSYFMTKPLVGPEAWTSMVKVLHKGLPDLRVTIDDEVAENDAVVVKWTALGTNTDVLMGYPASGMPVVLEGITWYRIAQGKLAENIVCEDQAALLRQVGVLHMPKQRDASHEYHKAIMYKFFDGIWNKADYSLIEEYVSPDMIQHIPGEGNGVDGFRETVRKYHAGFTEMRLEIQDEVAEGDRVLHRWNWTCTHSGAFNGIPATGRRVSFTGMTIARIRDGKMVEHWSNVDVVSLLMQLGVIPAPGQQ